MKQSQKKDVQIKVIERQSFNHNLKTNKDNGQALLTNPTVNLTTTVTLITGT